MRDRSVNYNNLCYINFSNANINTGKRLQFCIWNAQSLRNKTSVLHDYLCHNDIDICAITSPGSRLKTLLRELSAPHLVIPSKTTRVQAEPVEALRSFTNPLYRLSKLPLAKKHPFNSPNIQSSRNCGGYLPSSFLHRSPRHSRHIP